MAAELQGRTYYDVLGLPVSSTQVSLREIKAAYHRALLTAHPDKVLGTSGAEVDLVREAWRVLSDDVLRKEYDDKFKSIVLLSSFFKLTLFRW
jgi:curved DNA-binding protein CbpA